MQKIVFTGGGSAGHVIPNVAIIEELQKHHHFDLYYFGTNGIERGLIAPLKLPYACYSAPKLKRGMGWNALRNNLTIPTKLLTAVKQAKTELRRIQPDLVFSKGGYVSVPVVLAASKLGIPCITHESDLSPGLANRLIQSKCKRVLTAFPETADRFKHGVYCGQPLRASLFGVSKAQAKKELADGTQRKVVLIFGGGSGSTAINDAVRRIAPKLCRKYHLLHVCGKGNVVDSRIEHYQQFEFIEDMGTAYACADLVVSRAGAGAVFESMALKKPAVFIPLEGQTRGDQKENAEYFLSKKLCYALPQGNLDELDKSIEKALADDDLKKRLLLSPYGSGTMRCIQAITEIIGSP